MTPSPFGAGESWRAALETLFNRSAPVGADDADEPHLDAALKALYIPQVTTMNFDGLEMDYAAIKMSVVQLRSTGRPVAVELHEYARPSDDPEASPGSPHSDDSEDNNNNNNTKTETFHGIVRLVFPGLEDDPQCNSEGKIAVDAEMHGRIDAQDGRAISVLIQSRRAEFDDSE